MFDDIWSAVSGLTHAPRPTACRPAVCAVLRLEQVEDRITPTDFKWIGGVSESWSDPLNWQVLGAQLPKPRSPATLGPGPNDDTVLFDGAAQRNCVFDDSISMDVGGQTYYPTVRSLTVAATYNRSLVIDSLSHLVVSRGPQPNDPRGTFALASGGLAVEGALTLHGADGTWKGGSMNVRPGQQPGRIAVRGGSNLSIIDAGGLPGADHDLGAHLIISRSSASDTGRVYLGGQSGTGQKMSDNLRLFNNAYIAVLPGGELLLNQTKDSNTKGGIVKDATSINSIIYVGGLLDRAEKDQEDTENVKMWLKIEPRVTMSGTGRYHMAPLSSVVFWNGFHNDGGTIDIHRGRVQLPPFQKLTQTGGAMHLRGDGPLDLCLFVGDVDVLGGSVYVGENRTADAAADEFVEMRVTGDLDLGSLVAVYLSIDVGVSERGDVIRVDGHMSVDPIFVELTLVNNSRALWADIASRSWTFLSAGTADGYPGPGGIQAAVNGTEYRDEPDPDVERYTYNGPPDDDVPYYQFRYRPVY